MDAKELNSKQKELKKLALLMTKSIPKKTNILMVLIATELVSEGTIHQLSQENKKKAIEFLEVKLKDIKKQIKIIKKL